MGAALQVVLLIVPKIVGLHIQGHRPMLAAIQKPQKLVLFSHDKTGEGPARWGPLQIKAQRSAFGELLAGAEVEPFGKGKRGLLHALMYHPPEFRSWLLSDTVASASLLMREFNKMLDQTARDSAP